MINGTHPLRNRAVAAGITIRIALMILILALLSGCCGRWSGVRDGCNCCPLCLRPCHVSDQYPAHQYQVPQAGFGAPAYAMPQETGAPPAGTTFEAPANAPANETAEPPAAMPEVPAPTMPDEPGSGGTSRLDREMNIEKALRAANSRPGAIEPETISAKPSSVAAQPDDLEQWFDDSQPSGTAEPDVPWEIIKTPDTNESEESNGEPLASQTASDEGLTSPSAPMIQESQTMMHADTAAAGSESGTVRPLPQIREPSSVLIQETSDETAMRIRPLPPMATQVPASQSTAEIHPSPSGETQGKSMLRLQARPASSTRSASGVPATGASMHPARATIVGPSNGSLFIPPSAVEAVPATGPELEPLAFPPFPDIPATDSNSLDPRSAQPETTDVIR
jgi:hypothetical protein